MVTDRRNEKIKNVISNRQAGLVVVLEDIHDSHNAEAILRSCDAFGVQKVFFIFDQEKPYNPAKVGKSSSSSANKWLSFEIFHSTDECIASLKKQHYRIVATALTGTTKNILQAALLDTKLALCVGNEHRGLSPAMLSSADTVVQIPMAGMVQSLNVSVFTAVLLFEIIRQRSLSKKSYSLSVREQQTLIQRFIDL